MDIVGSIILGIVQGLTEFLPVSSSAHLVIFQNLIPGFKQPGVLFDVVLHLGTLIAVVYFYRKIIFRLGKKYYFLLLVGTIPAGLAGFLFQSQLESMFGSIRGVGIELIITAILNFMIDASAATGKVISVKNSFLIGVAQAIAIIPGISRSGATIFAGVKLGITREKTAEFSFILSIPAILGANVLQFVSHGTDGILSPGYYLYGFIAAFITGFISIGLVLKTLSQRRFKIFGFYCLIAGVLVLLLGV